VIEPVKNPGSLKGSQSCACAADARQRGAKKRGAKTSAAAKGRTQPADRSNLVTDLGTMNQALGFK
jgi:hypothetical protein